MFPRLASLVTIVVLGVAALASTPTDVSNDVTILSTASINVRSAIDIFKGRVTLSNAVATHIAASNLNSLLTGATTNVNNCGPFNANDVSEICGKFGLFVPEIIELLDDVQSSEPFFHRLNVGVILCQDITHIQTSNDAYVIALLDKLQQAAGAGCPNANNLVEQVRAKLVQTVGVACRT